MRDKARIVIEGMDGSGKSTLVKQLLDHYGAKFEYVRTLGPKPELGQWWMEQLGHNPQGRAQLHDRFFYPEVVYGPVLRGKISVEGHIMQYVSEYLRANAILVYCRPRVETIEKGILAADQWPGVKENFHALLKAYDDCMIHEGDWYGEDRFFLYDWEDDRGMLQLVMKLEGYLQ